MSIKTTTTAIPALEVTERLPLSEHPLPRFRKTNKTDNIEPPYFEDMQQEQAISMYLGNSKQAAWRDSRDAWKKNYKWGKHRDRNSVLFGDDVLSLIPSESFEDKVIDRVLIDQIRQLTLRLRRVKILNHNEYKVIRLHGFQGVFMKDVAKRLGLGESRVCQIFHEAVRKIRMFV